MVSVKPLGVVTCVVYERRYVSNRHPGMLVSECESRQGLRLRPQRAGLKERLAAGILLHTGYPGTRRRCSTIVSFVASHESCQIAASLAITAERIQEIIGGRRSVCDSILKWRHCLGGGLDLLSCSLPALGLR